MLVHSPMTMALKEVKKMKKFSPLYVAVALVFLNVSGTVWAQSTTIGVATDAGVSYLTDSSGKTLYYFTKDVMGESVCTDGCLNAWPVFYAPAITVPSSLSANDFGTITRSDGTKQTTYKGWPLYYFAKDMNPGDMKGDAVNNVWFVLKVPFYTVMIATSPTLGNYMTDANGMALYLYTKDPANESVCNGNCLKNWPAFFASSIVAPAGVNPSDFKTITRDDGTRQTTFKGYPLYYWVKDTKRGDTTGEDVGHVWYVIDPEKQTPAT